MSCHRPSSVVCASYLFAMCCLSSSPSALLAENLEHTAASLTKSAASRAASGSTDIKDIAVDAANLASKNAIKAAKQKAEDGDLPDWLTRTDIELTFKKDGDPSLSIETIQPIKQDELNTTFWQGRFASRDGDQTLNLGLGYRRLVRDKQWMLGANAFVDRSLKYKHQRTGLGLEAFGPYSTLRYNRYNATSDEKLISSIAGIKTIEIAQSGWDLGVETPMPYVDWANINFKHYQWDGVRQDDTEGNSLSVRMYPTDNLEIEVGAQHDNTDDTRSFANLVWYFDKPSHAPRKGKSRQVFAARDVSEHRLEKVRRHNDIVVETHTTGSVAITIGRGT